MPIMLLFIVFANIVGLLIAPWVNYYAYSWILGLDEFVTMDWGLLVDGLLAASQLAIFVGLVITEVFFGSGRRR